MKTKWYVYLAIVLVVAGLAMPTMFSTGAVDAVNGPIDRDLDSYVLFALDELDFKGGNEGTYTRGYVLGGNVGVNQDQNIGDNQASINVGANGLFVMSDNTQLVGGSIRLGEEASVWDVYVEREFGSGWGAINPKIGGLTIRNAQYLISNATDLPIIDPVNLTTDVLCGPFDPVGTTDITVPKNGTLNLAPGAYQDVQVQDGATLHLVAGTYTVRRFNTGQNVNVYTVPGTVIHIWGDGDPNSREFNLGGNGSYFGSEDPGVESVACICVSDTYANSTVGFSDNGEFWGVIYAPNAPINLGRGFTHFGRFVGRTIASDFNVNVTYKVCTADPPDDITLSATKTASGHLGVEHQWTIEKTVTPDTWHLFKGDSATSLYTLTVTKSEGEVSTAHVEGEICVTNEGNVATEGLQITDTVTDPLDNVMGSIAVDVSAKPALLPGETFCYPYRVDFTDPGQADDTTVYTNTAEITISNGDPVEATATTTLTLAPVNESISVTDTNGYSWTFDGSASETYEKTFVCDGDSHIHTNRAVIEDTGQFAEATVQVFCYELEVSKEAHECFDRLYMWEITKSAMWEGEPVTELTLSEGQQAMVNFQVTVDVSYQDQDFAVSGPILIHNPAPVPATINSLTDIVSPPDIAAVVTCGASFPYVMAPGETLECQYTADLPDSQSRLNTATAILQNHAYDEEGGSTESGTTDYSAQVGVVVCEPPANEIDECIRVYDSNFECEGVIPGNFPGGLLDIVSAPEAPKSFDYTRVIGPFWECGTYIVSNEAYFVTNDTTASESSTWTIVVEVPCEGCTLTPGYWKTHSEYGPAPYDATWALLSPDGADTPFFDTGQTWYEVLWTNPEGGNAYYILAHAYIAAYLNVLNGASVPVEVADAMAYAEYLLDEYDGDPQGMDGLKGKKAKEVRQDFIDTYYILDQYNNGFIGPGHCTT
jgi:hypothetical protein